MLGRLVLGLSKGLAVGGAIALALFYALHLVTWGGIVPYAAAAVTGVLVGLVAGKPIWAEGAKIEAGLKAFFGALLAAGAMYAVRRWLGMEVNLGALTAGAAQPLGTIPTASIPIVATALAVLYELDNTSGGEKASGAPGRRASKVQGARKRIEAGEGALEDDEVPDEASAKNKRRR